MKRIVACLFFVFGIAAPVFAGATIDVGARAKSSLYSRTRPAPLPPGFVVSPLGSDSNIGTLAAPFQTLGKCQTAMRASTIKTCYVRAGTYAPSGTGTDCDGSLSSILDLTTADNGEIWSYYPPDGYLSAFINGGASGSSGVGCGIYSAANNLTVNGLVFENYRAYGIETTGSAPLIKNVWVTNITDTGVQGSAGIVTQNAANGQIIHNRVDTTVCMGIATFPQTSGGANNLLIAYNYVYNYATAFSDCGGIYMENNSAQTQSGEIIEYNYVQDGSAGGGANAIYIDDLSSNFTILSNVERVGGGSAYPCVFYHGGSNNVSTGNICDLSTGASGQILTIQNESGTPSGNSFTASLILAKLNSGSGGGYPCNTGPCGTSTIGPNNYYNYGTSGTLSTSGSAGSDSNPQTSNPNFTCGWEYTLPSNSPVYASPVSFPVQPATWGTPGFWGPPGFMPSQVGTPPSPTHTC